LMPLLFSPPLLTLRHYWLRFRHITLPLIIDIIIIDIDTLLPAIIDIDYSWHWHCIDAIIRHYYFH
jgi:hypothetical protein